MDFTIGSDADVAQQYLTFSVAGDEYALPILRVREILAYTPLTRVPRAPEFVAGVMNLRGIVVPVIDLCVKLGLPTTTIHPTTCIVLIDIVEESRPTSVGLLVDDVCRVIALTPDEVAPPPAFGTRIDLDYLRGMGDLGDHFALILDIDRLLTALELLAAQSAADGTSAAHPAPAVAQNDRSRAS
jgi:purine-binding chemotaxis protein CheW